MSSFWDKIYLNFIKEDRYMYLVNGLKNTLIITLFAVLIGVALGFLVAVVRSTYSKTKKLWLLDKICGVYLTVVRGTPMMVQLLIMFYVIFASSNNKMLVAVIAFGPLTPDNLRRAEALALVIRGPCGTLFCPRPLKMSFRLLPMSLLFC